MRSKLIKITLPGGIGYSDGSFGYVGKDGLWWSATERDASYAWDRNVRHYNAKVYRSDGDKSGLFSVRCVQD